MTIEKCFWKEVLEKIVNSGHKNPKWLDNCNKCSGYHIPCDEYYNPRQDDWNEFMNERFK